MSVCLTAVLHQMIKPMLAADIAVFLVSACLNYILCCVDASKDVIVNIFNFKRKHGCNYHNNTTLVFGKVH